MRDKLRNVNSASAEDILKQAFHSLLDMSCTLYCRSTDFMSSGIDYFPQNIFEFICVWMKEKPFGLVER